MNQLKPYEDCKDFVYAHPDGEWHIHLVGAGLLIHYSDKSPSQFMDMVFDDGSSESLNWTQKTVIAIDLYN